MQGLELIAEFFGPGRQTSDTILPVSLFVCLSTLVHVRLPPAEQAVNRVASFLAVANTGTSWPRHSSHSIFASFCRISFS